MNKGISKAVAVVLLISAGYVCAEKVHDWREIHHVHEQVEHAIHELEDIRAANHYDMAGHGARAEQLLREAEHELHEAVEAVKRDRD